MFAPNAEAKRKRKREPQIEELLPHSLSECHYRLENMRRPGLVSEFYRDDDDELGFNMTHTDYGLLPVSGYHSGASLTYVRIRLSGTLKPIATNKTLVLVTAFTDPSTFIINSGIMTVLGAPLLMIALRNLRWPMVSVTALVILAVLFYLTIAHPRRMGNLHAGALERDIREQLGINGD